MSPEAKYLNSAAFAADVALFQRASQGLAKAMLGHISSATAGIVFLVTG